MSLNLRYDNLEVTGIEKEQLKQQINNIEYEINQEIYKIYSITKDEQNIIEDSLK
jgi:hypothetical protein